MYLAGKFGVDVSEVSFLNGFPPFKIGLISPVMPNDKQVHVAIRMVISYGCFDGRGPFRECAGEVDQLGRDFEIGRRPLVHPSISRRFM